MAQLDRFLSAMVSHRASALRLDETALAELEISGAARPVTKAPLTGAQVVSLLREVAPAAAGEALAGEGVKRGLDARGHGHSVAISRA